MTPTVGWRSRRCWWGMQEDGQPGPYHCSAKPSVWRFGRGWCELHDPVTQMLGVALVVVTRRAA